MTHVDQVLDLLSRADLDDVVLCGHSYGGMVARGVVEKVPSAIRALIYLDAFVPDTGDSVASLLGAPATEELTLPPPPAAWFGLSGDDAVWVDQMMTPQPAKTFRDSLALRGAYSGSQTYVLATGWASSPHFAANFDRAVASPQWHARRIDGSHDLMIDRANEVRDVLLAAAGASTTS